MRRWIGAVVTVVLLLPGAANAGEAAVAPLSGTNVVTSQGDGRLDVRLDHDAVIDLTPRDNPDGELWPAALQIDGDAAGFVGFILTEPDTSDGFLAVALRTPAPIRDGDAVHAAFAYGQLAKEDRATADEPHCVRCSIPAGQYHLYILTDDDTTVTLSVEGLDGTAALHADDRVASWATDFEPHEFGVTGAGGGGHATWMASSAGGPGLFINTYRLTLTSDTPVAGFTRECRGSDDAEECQDHVLAGVGDAVGGMHVTTQAAIDKGVHASMNYDVVGMAHVTAGSDLLWVPLTVSGGDGPPSNVEPPEVRLNLYTR